MGRFFIQNPRTGVKEQIVNGEFYPAFLLLPEIAFENYPSIVNSVTRFPKMFLLDHNTRDFVASDNFLLCIIDFYAYLAWPTIAKMFGLCKYMEVYSGYDFAYKIAHAPQLWINTMEEEGILPRTSRLISSSDFYEYFGFVSLEETSAIMEYIVPIALKRTGLDKIIEIGIEYRCIEDFDFCNSNKKTDFLRKWYHSRTKLYKELNNIQKKKRSEDKTEAELLDDLIGNKEKTDNITSKPVDPENWNMIHSRRKPEAKDPDDMISYIETKVAVNDFLMQIPQEDYDLLMMGFQGKTQKEIAETLHLDTHSAVSKRRKRLIAEFEKISGVEINKKAIRRKKK